MDGMPLLHMADSPEAKKNLDDLDNLEMEEDLVPARDALLATACHAWLQPSHGA